MSKKNLCLIALAAGFPLTGCAERVRNGEYTKGWYDACMRRIGVDEDDEEWPRADKVCRQRAKQDQYVEPDSETICRNQFGELRCETYVNDD